MVIYSFSKFKCIKDFLEKMEQNKIIVVQQKNNRFLLTLHVKTIQINLI